MPDPLERQIAQKIQQAATPDRAKILGQQRLWPELLTAKDLLQLPPDPTRWVLDQCLPAGGCSLLVAKPKVGKSTLAVCLALSVARGMTFFGRATTRGPVAYLSLDASLPEIAEVFLHFGLKETDPIFIHAGAAPRDAVAWIMHRVKENGVKLVIIDTLQRLFRFQNINDYSEVTNLLEPLLESARQQNCHVLITHHAKKDSADDFDSAIGSSALRGMFYQYLHLKRLPNSETRIFRTDGRGGKNFGEYAVGFNKTGFMDIEGTREETEVQEIKPAVLEYFTESPESTERELRSNVQGQPRILGKALRELVKEDELERIGKGKRGDPFRYQPARKLELVSGLKNPGRYSSLFPSKEKTTTPEKTSIPFDGKDNEKSHAYAGLFGNNKPEINQKKPETRNVSPKNQYSKTPDVDRILAEIEAEKER